MMLTLRRVVAFYMSAQFVRFIAVGGIAVLLHWLSRFVFNSFMSYGWAIVMAYAIGMIVAFVLNRIYVFPLSEQSVNFEVFFFFLVNIAAFPLVWAAAYVVGEWVLVKYMPQQLAFAVAHGFAITLPVFANYALHKLITFRGA